VTNSGTPSRASDEQLAERLARLNQRRQSTAGPTGGAPAPARKSRRHPAARARAAALLLTLVSTGGLGALFADLNAAPAAAPQAVGTLPTPASAAGTPLPTAPATQAFNGSAVTTKFGPVQVQAQISNGTIIDVVAIASPDGDNKSRSINAQALPMLRSEVLTAQRANVHTISGATYTSNAYRQSLQAALDRARAAGATTIV
jgi:uncharacterized protein with FMN-binding domain